MSTVNCIGGLSQVSLSGTLFDLTNYVSLRYWSRAGPTPSGEPFVIRDILNAIVLIHVCFYWIIIKLIIIINDIII